MNAQLQQPLGHILPNVPWDEYLRLPGCSITRLKELRRSPQHYKYRLQNPKESAPLTLGRAAHCAVLEPERFTAEHAVWERRTGSGKLGPRNGKAWDAFKAENAARTIITADELSEVLAIQEAVRGNADAMRYLSKGAAEVTMQWTMFGRLCKGRMDWLNDSDGPIPVGLKTARDCRHFQFGSQAARLGYHLQWAFYADGFKTITGDIPKKVVEIVVETEPPHAVAVYIIPDDILQQGFEEYSQLLEQLDECERNKSWPGPATGEQILTLPSWVYDRDEDISDLGLEA